MRNLLAPIAIFYGLVLRIRHWLYDTGLIASYRPSVLTICVGNLEFGGTGKTPHSIYLIEKLISQGQRPGFVSRGYGRLTKGLKTVDLDSTANQVGDEPLLIKNKFPEIPVVVCESREEGILYLERVHPNLSVLILDDAFQHRRVSPHYSILLTNGEQPYWKNKLFPWGSLRDIPQSEKRANMVITTRIKTKTQSYVRGKAWVIESEQKIGKPICKSLKKPEKAIERWLVFCGIAKPGQFIDSVKQVSQI
ncbi:MAG: tetraacyldisaccharide 4'-kinase, partial [Bacteroidia bacterium]|nr:tetraacyldisaccharide 4'-kinase [Bacteroidia bacterium]